MFAVTGGAGFIGSNLIRGLNARGHRDILVADDPTSESGRANLHGCEFLDHVDKRDFQAALRRRDPALSGLRAVFHQGACTDTLERDEQRMMRSNYEYSRDLLNYCGERRVPLIYASSAAVYGAGTEFTEEARCERPVNVYGRSKKRFDDYVRDVLPSTGAQLVGLRYFNVYGPGEQHKGPMASIVYQLYRQITEGGGATLFGASGGFGDGEQRRDFICVEDVVAVNLWFLSQPSVSGIYNVGTGRSRSFNDVARVIIAWHGSGKIRYRPFPPELRDVYQSYTEADLRALRRAGCMHEFTGIEQGITHYLDRLAAACAPPSESRA